MLARFTPPEIIGARNLQVGLAIKRGGEGHVVEGLWRSIRTRVRLHALNTVFSLVWRKLTLQFFRKDVWLKRKKRDNLVDCHNKR